MNIRIIGNDIEIDGEKVARIFDIRPTLRDRLEGKEHGKEEGRQEGYEQREAEEQNTN